MPDWQKIPDKIAQNTQAIEPKHPDLTGGVLWVMLVSLYVLLLNGISASPTIFVLISTTFIVILGMFIKVEMTANDPILPVFLVKKHYYWTAVSTAAISFAALFIPLILIPFYLDYIMYYPAGMIGMVMMSLPVSLVIMSPFSGWLYDRLGSARIISTIGLLVSLSAIVLLMQLRPNSHPASICIRLVMLGAGQSIFLSPNSASVLKKVQERYAGITSGILATARNFGMLTGAGIAGSCFSVLFARYTDGFSLQQYTVEFQDSFMLAQQNTLGIAMVLLVIASCISIMRS